jgi:hypothetical protein
MIPLPDEKVGYITRPARADIVRLIPTPVATQLTGLSTDKLREWTSRRALVPADVRPKQKGSPAQFTWQTTLILRIAVLLRDQFAIELQSYKLTFANLRKELRATSFVGLWGRSVALGPHGKCFFMDHKTQPLEMDALVVHLDPHLTVIRDGFALTNAAAVPGQFDLFSLPALRKKSETANTKTSKASRRRSA